MELDKFKCHMIRRVSHYLLENKSGDEVMKEFQQHTGGYNCRALWLRMRAVTLQKLNRLVEADDKVINVDPPARMTYADWLLLDLVIVHEDVDLIEKVSEENQEILFGLVVRNEVEGSQGEDLANAWTEVTFQYNIDGRQCSAMLLQRRWYQMKAKVRDSYYKLWYTYRGNIRLLDKCTNIIPSKLQSRIAQWCPYIITKPWLNWHKLNDNLLTTPNEFEKKIKAKCAAMKKQANKTNCSVDVKIEDDVIILDPELETETLESLKDDCEDGGNQPQENFYADLTISPETLAKLLDERDKKQLCYFLNDDTGTDVYDNMNEHINKEDSVISTDSVVKKPDNEETKIKQKKSVELGKNNDKIDKDVSMAIYDLTTDEQNTRSSINFQHSVTNEDNAKDQENKDSINNINQDKETINITKYYDPENKAQGKILETLERINSAMSLEELGIVIVDEGVDLDHFSSKNEKDDAYMESDNIKVEPLYINNIKSEPQELNIKAEPGSLISAAVKNKSACKDLNSKEVMSETICIDLSTEQNDENKEINAKQYITNHLDTVIKDGNQVNKCVNLGGSDPEDKAQGKIIETLARINSGVSLDELGIEIIDEGVDTDDVHLSNLNNSAEISEIVENDEQNHVIDSKLLMLPVVYTTKLDNMPVFKNNNLQQVCDKSILEQAFIESKPIFKPSYHKNTASEDNNVDNPDKTDSGSESDYERLDITNSVFNKPKICNYNPVQVCKNPDFNTRLRRLTAGFLSIPRNMEHLKKLKPLTIDLSKAFEDKLIYNTMYLKSRENNCVGKKDIVLQQHEDLIDLTALRPTHYTTKVTSDRDEYEEKTLTFMKNNEEHESQILNLPEYCSAHKINETDAEVNPMQLSQSVRLITSLEALYAKQEHNSDCNESKKNLTKSESINSTDVNSVITNANTSLSNNENCLNTTEEDNTKAKKAKLKQLSKKMTLEFSTWLHKPLQTAEISAINETLLTIDALQKMISLTDDEEPNIIYSKKKPANGSYYAMIERLHYLEYKSKIYKNNEIFKKGAEEYDVDCSSSSSVSSSFKKTQINVIHESDINDTAKKEHPVKVIKKKLQLRKAVKMKPRVKPRVTLYPKDFCCWARIKIVKRNYRGRHKCPPICVCCCRHELAQKTKWWLRGKNDVDYAVLTKNTSGSVEGELQNSPKLNDNCTSDNTERTPIQNEISDSEVVKRCTTTIRAQTSKYVVCVDDKSQDEDVSFTSFESQYPHICEIQGSQGLISVIPEASLVQEVNQNSQNNFTTQSYQNTPSILRLTNNKVKKKSIVEMAIQCELDIDGVLNKHVDNEVKINHDHFVNTDNDVNKVIENQILNINAIEAGNDDTSISKLVGNNHMLTNRKSSDAMLSDQIEAEELPIQKTLQIVLLPNENSTCTLEQNDQLTLGETNPSSMNFINEQQLPVQNENPDNLEPQKETSTLASTSAYIHIPDNNSETNVTNVSPRGIRRNIDSPTKKINTNKTSLLSDLMLMSGISSEDVITTSPSPLPYIVPVIMASPSMSNINFPNNVISGLSPRKICTQLKIGSQPQKKYFKLDLKTGCMSNINITVNKPITTLTPAVSDVNGQSEMVIDLTDEVELEKNYQDTPAISKTKHRSARKQSFKKWHCEVPMVQEPSNFVKKVIIDLDESDSSDDEPLSKKAKKKRLEEQTYEYLEQSEDSSEPNTITAPYDMNINSVPSDDDADCILGV